MLPKPPPREAPLGFVYDPPFRVQGLSVAGEATAIQVPELDVCFDMGAAPRALLNSKVVALSHGHMDHIGGLAYYCSQRQFQGMGTGVIVCDERIEQAVHKMMRGFVDLERQKTPYEVVPLSPESEYELKRGVVLRGFQVEHTCEAYGYTVIEKRSKLLPQYTGMPQEKLREIKAQGQSITAVHDIPLVAYLGDTLPGPWLVREDVRKAQVVICECTFMEDDHEQRAKVGKHMHVSDIAEWLPVLECNRLILTHVSRRVNLQSGIRKLRALVGPEHMSKVSFLMDHRTNRERYEKQVIEAEAALH